MQVLATLIVNKIRGIVDCCFLVNKGMTGCEVMIFFGCCLKESQPFLDFWTCFFDCLSCEAYIYVGLTYLPPNLNVLKNYSAGTIIYSTDSNLTKTRLRRLKSTSMTQVRFKHLASVTIGRPFCRPSTECQKASRRSEFGSFLLLFQ